MTLAIYSAFAIPIWIAQFVLYFTLRKHRLMKESLWAKCAGTLLSAGSAMCALLPGAGGGEMYSVLLPLAFFILCTAADALLEINFTVGMAAFAAGHMCLIIFLWRSFSVSWATLIVWAAAMAAAVIIFKKELPKLGALLVPSIIYVAILSLTLALCLPLGPASLGLGSAGAYTQAGPKHWLLSIGALSFFISDMMVAKSQFGFLGDKYQKPVMALYWLALYLISACLW